MKLAHGAMIAIAVVAGVIIGHWSKKADPQTNSAATTLDGQATTIATGSVWPNTARTDPGPAVQGSAAGSQDYIADTSKAAQHQLVHDGLLRRFDGEAEDRVWARGAAAAFREDLDILGDKTFSIKDVSCKTTMCVARLRWADYTAAQSSTRKLLATRYQKNCAREVYIPAPTDPTLPYESAVTFDCEESRVDVR